MSELPLDLSSSAQAPVAAAGPTGVRTAGSPICRGTPFLAFAQACARIGSVRSKLEKIRLLAEFLRPLRGPELRLAATWFSGRPFPAGQNKVLQLGWAVLRDALTAASGATESVFHETYLKYSDLGETAAEILQSRTVEGGLSVNQVGELFEALYAARGPLSKTPLLTRVLERCTTLEAKYLVKTITGDLRIGLKEGLVEDALAAAFEQTAATVRQAGLLLGDIGETAVLASENRLREAKVVPFRPIKFMLASPEPSAAAVCQRLQSSEPAGSLPGEKCPRLWLEDKYDGIRCQMHKVGARVALYSRDMKDVTATFPELTAAAQLVRGDFILDAEIIAGRGDQVMPFADLQRRLGRREPDLFMYQEVPVQLMVFDLLWEAGESRLAQPLSERRRRLEALAPFPPALALARLTPAASAEEIESAFAAARGRGNEGLMIKQPSSPYSPGRRGLGWLKLKKPLATLDCIIVGAEYGHGKRSQVLSDYTFAVRDETSGELRTIGKAYTGLTDAEIEELTTRFLQTGLRRQTRYFDVPPEVVLEVAFDRIQPSRRHNSGLALRFPRIVRIRTDKTAADINTLGDARELAKKSARQ
jgi:DNA ligase-1